MKKLILLIGITYLNTATSYGVLTCQKCMEAHKKDGTKSPFSCHKLETMAKHLLLNHGTYLCCDCRRHFKDLNSYRTHMLDVHKKTACRYCIRRTFEKTEDYELHRDASHVDYGWRCHVCREGIPTLERFIIHTAVRHKQYICRHYMKQIRENENVKKEIKAFKTERDYLAHAIHGHGEFICMECNMRAFDSQKDRNEHCGSCAGGRQKQKITVSCEYCRSLKIFRCEAEKNLHDLQHVFLLYFLKTAIPGYACCVPFCEAVRNAQKGNKQPKEEETSATKAVQAFSTHVANEHKRCLFCENPVAKESAGILEGNLANLTYKQIRYDARMFIQLDANKFSKGEIPVIPCDMCGSALQPNRKSRLFFASIKELPFGKGLNIRDYPFHHLEYDEQKAEKNTVLSVIKEVPANEEESFFVPKQDEKDAVISGEEDEAEDEGIREEEEDKEDEKEPETKEGK